jgi:hypothetical protein
MRLLQKSCKMTPPPFYDGEDPLEPKGAGGKVKLQHTDFTITTHDVGALLAAPRLGGASAAPTINMFNCRSNKCLSCPSNTGCIIYLLLSTLHTQGKL